MMPLRGVLAVLMLSVTAGEVLAQRVKLTVPMAELVLRAERDSNDAPAHYGWPSATG